MRASRVQETLLELNPADFSELQEAKDQLQPYEDLWKLVERYHEKFSVWFREPVFNLDAAEVRARACAYRPPRVPAAILPFAIAPGSCWLCLRPRAD